MSSRDSDLPPSVSDEQLATVEKAIQGALESRSFDGLTVLGFGEIGVAIGVPAGEPVAVVKRLASCPTQAEIDEWFAFLRRYEAALAPHVAIAPTDQRTIPGGPDGRLVPFLVQPLFPREQLVEVILEQTEPVVDHAVVVAVRDAALSAVADGRQAIDSQFSNFAWDGEQLWLFDSGSPFLYNADGSPDYELGSYARAIPAVLRPATRRIANKVCLGLGGANGNLAHAALSAVRIGQERWLDAILETFNSAIVDRSLGEPIERDDVMKQMAGVQNEMKAIKTIARTQRAYVTKVRRQTYDFFITDSFTGEVL